MWRTVSIASVLFWSAFCSIALAANFRLYLKDGGHQMVREYKVEGDRVRYYSIERSDWEEIPLALVDLQKTESENSSRQTAIEKKAKEIAEEDAAAAELRKQILKIPQDPGVYTLNDAGQLRIFKVAESTLHNSKGRKALKLMTGLPIIPGKATLEIPGDHSLNTVTETRPEFYIQLTQQDRFAIIKLKPTKGVRIVEDITIVPGSNENIEERQEMQIFTEQLTENFLFKIWPQEALEKGDYAVIEFIEGKVNPQIWDFRVQ